jgi:hypothetical protein
MLIANASHARVSESYFVQAEPVELPLWYFAFTIQSPRSHVAPSAVLEARLSESVAMP